MALVNRSQWLRCRGRRDQYTVDLPGYVALQAAHDLPLALALSSASCDVVLGAPVAAHAHHADHVQGPVGIPVAATVEPMPDHFARGGIDGRDPAEAGERSFAAQALGVVP